MRGKMLPLSLKNTRGGQKIEKVWMRRKIKKAQSAETYSLNFSARMLTRIWFLAACQSWSKWFYCRCKTFGQDIGLTRSQKTGFHDFFLNYLSKKKEHMASCFILFHDVLLETTNTIRLLEKLLNALLNEERVWKSSNVTLISPFTMHCHGRT